MKITQAVISLSEMKFYAFHGVLPQERTVGAQYTVSLDIETSDIASAIDNDSLDGTINYAEVYALVEKEMQQPSELLEHLAGRILRRLFAAFPLAHRATVRVMKHRPPIAGANVDASAVTLKAER